MLPGTAWCLYGGQHGKLSAQCLPEPSGPAAELYAPRGKGEVEGHHSGGLQAWHSPAALQSEDTPSAGPRDSVERGKKTA